jgi:hypothetical protein
MIRDMSGRNACDALAFIGWPVRQIVSRLNYFFAATIFSSSMLPLRSASCGTRVANERTTCRTLSRWGFGWLWHEAPEVTATSAGVGALFCASQPLTVAKQIRKSVS